MEEMQRELQQTKKHCCRVIKQRDDWHAKYRQKTFELRKIIAGVRKDNDKLKSEKFELSIKYHEVCKRLLH